jgi:PAS domain-containing protein
MTASQATDPNVASLLANLSGFFDHAPWAVTELAGESHVVRYANSVFCRLIDKSRDEIIGRSIDELLPPGEKCVALLDQVFRTGIPEIYISDEQAPHPLLFSFSLWPVITDGRTAGVMIQVN